VPHGLMSNRAALHVQSLWALLCPQSRQRLFSLHSIELCSGDVVHFVGFKEQTSRELLIN
jgi:hypothetical protein